MKTRITPIVFVCIFAVSVMSYSFPGQNSGNEFIALAQKANQFVTRINNHEFEAAREQFDAKMMQVMAADKLEQVMTTITSQFGAFKEKLGLRTENYPPYRIVYVVSKFEKADLDIKIVFNEQEQIAGLFFVPSQGLAEYSPPDYVDEDSFYEIDTLKIPNNWSLPAVASIPGGDGPFPCVVLVHGSGPNDRDETVGANKPFRDLAWGLASRQVAVVRYDKRTRVWPAKMDSLRDQITVMEETIEDALSAVSLARSLEHIDENRIVVLGHSLGGMLAPRMKELYPRISGFILMAAPARKLETLIPEQLSYIYTLDGKISAEEQATLDSIREKVARVQSGNLTENTPAEQLPFNVNARYWLDLEKYDQVKTAAGLNRPLLILQGGRDYQVPVKDYHLWQQGLAGQPDVTFKLYAGLNHLFMAGEGQSRPEEYQLPGHVAQDVINDIAQWIENSIK